MVTDNESVRHNAHYIREAGDAINDIANLWVDAASKLRLDAKLSEDAMGAVGQKSHFAVNYNIQVADLGDDKLTQSSTGVCAARDALWAVADAYEGAEAKAKEAARGAIPSKKPMPN